MDDSRSDTSDRHTLTNASLSPPSMPPESWAASSQSAAVPPSPGTQSDSAQLGDMAETPSPPPQQSPSANAAGTLSPKTPPRIVYQLGNAVSPLHFSLARTIHGAAGLEASRQTILYDLGNRTHQFATGYFHTDLLPPIPSQFNVKAIKEQLIEKQILTDDGWAVFKNGIASQSTENNAYSRISDIFKGIDSFVLPRFQYMKRFGYHTAPNATPDDRSVKTGNAKPDGTMLRFEVPAAPGGQAGEDVSTSPAPRRSQRLQAQRKLMKYVWYNLGSTWEFRLVDSPANRGENTSKVLGGMNTMLSDPRRRFTYGVTMVNTTVNMWYAGRNMVAVSDDFDFMKDPEAFIRLYLSLTYSEDPDLVHHGWDPTIKHLSTTIFLPEGRKPSDERALHSYEFNIKGHIFTDAQIIDDQSTRCFLGRATRIFRAQDQATGEIVVIKDMWLADDREPDYKVYEALRAAVKESIQKDRPN